jgi:hypothetical protein
MNPLFFKENRKYIKHEKLNYFLTNIFFEIFKLNPIAIKCIIAPTIIAVIKLSSTIQVIKNVIIDGIVTIAPIIVPFKIISLILSLDFVESGNRTSIKNGNKNQRDFIKSCSHQTLIEKGF